MRYIVLSFGLVLAAYVDWTSARVVEHKRQDVAYQQCTYDALYNGLWSYTPNAHEASSACNELLGNDPSTECLGTNTFFKTIYPSATSTKTVTKPTTVASQTKTVTSMKPVLGMRRRDADMAPAPTPPPMGAPRGLPKGKALEEFIVKRQLTANATATNSRDFTRSLISACACNVDLCATTLYKACRITRTRTDPVVKIYRQTVYTKVYSGVTTVTETVNVTTQIDTTTSFDPPTTSWSVAIDPRGTPWTDWTRTSTTSDNATATTHSITNATTSTSSYEIDPIFQTTTSSSTSTPEIDSSTTTSSAETLTVSSTSLVGSTTESTPDITSSVVSTASDVTSTTATTTVSWSTTSVDSSASNTTSSTIPVSSSSSSAAATNSLTSTATDVTSTVEVTITETATATSTTVTAATTSMTTPSGCPDIDGHIFDKNPQPCQAYEYACGQTYAESDFYDSEQYWPTPEGCTAVCDSMNTGGKTACVGIVWNTTSVVDKSANCRQLKSLDMPSDDASSVALLLVPTPDNPECNSSSTTTTTASRTATTTSIFYNSTTTTTTKKWYTGTGIWNDTLTRNGTWPDWHWNKTTSRSRNSTTSPGPYTTTTANFSTTSTTTLTTTTNTTRRYTHNGPYMTGGTGTGSRYPRPTANTTCKPSTMTVPTTIYATMFHTVTIPVNSTQVPSIVTVTVTNLASTITKTETETETVGGWAMWHV